MDNLLLYVMDRHNTGIGDAVDVVASPHLITAHDVVLEKPYMIPNMELF